MLSGTFFPRVAYRQVKAVAKPDLDYDGRLMKAFERDIHDYHRKLGDQPEQAELVGIEVPRDRARWMKPGSEGNKLGYFRVLRSTLRFRDAAGKEQSLTVTSLISWRGEWFDAYDALLWLVAFVTLELDVLGRAKAAGLVQPSGESTAEFGDKV